jgi:catechol 2,3-dioxygenase-like lactoylglutathione lyase family enzyme
MEGSGVPFSASAAIDNAGAARLAPCSSSSSMLRPILWQVGPHGSGAPATAEKGAVRVTPADGGTTMATRPIRGLGEIALRVHDLAAMRAFYEQVVGLEVMQAFPHAVFFRIAEGVAGHTQILALFDRSATPRYGGLSRQQTTLDHLAFAIAVRDFATELVRLESLGLEVTTTEHAWTHWRSLYFADPEGNQVEFVCYDATV